MKKVIYGYNDLLTQSPGLAAEWHPTKNGELTPDAVSVHSNKKVWWLGKCGHEWEASIHSRYGLGRGCPHCSRNRTLSETNNLKAANESLAAEWHPTKNGDLTPDKVTPKSGKKVWWLGKCGHEWQASVYNMSRGHGCPYCAGKQVLKGFNDLATENPQLASEWHPTKNGDLTPEMVTAHNGKIVWWQCSKGHEWKTAIYIRNSGNDCPYCAKEKARKTREKGSLAVEAPELAAEWHPTKNGELTPDKVTVSSAKRVWWLGKCGHEWQTVVSCRYKGSKCPYCAGNRILKGFNDLATKYPELAAEWHPTKNGELTPDMVMPGIRRKVWWQCSKGHAWQASLYNRTNHAGCPYCFGRYAIKGENDLATIKPELAAEWHPTKNGDLTPDMFRVNSSKKVWWKCSNGHEWQAMITSRYNGSGCPRCAGHRVFKGINDLATTHPTLAKEWHPTKNGNLTPDKLSVKSNKSVWWKCPEGHEFRMTIYNRGKRPDCPYCSGRRVIKKDETPSP